LTYPWERHSQCKTHKSLKENLYKDIIENFEKGKMWEMALQVTKFRNKPKQNLSLNYKINE